MKQDVIIRWLMESVNADELAQANENGTTISYYAGVAQRFPANEVQANTRRPARPAPAVAQEQLDVQPPVAARRNPVRQPAAAPVADLNNNENEAPAAPQVARRPGRQAQAGADRVGVGRY